MRKILLLPLIVLLSTLIFSGCSSDSVSLGGETDIHFETDNLDEDGESAQGNIILKFGDRDSNKKRGQGELSSVEAQKGVMLSAAQKSSDALVGGSNIEEAYVAGKKVLGLAGDNQVSSGKTEDEIVYTIDGYSLSVDPEGTIAYDFNQ